MLLFGSVARGTERENSDIDLAISASGVDLPAVAPELGALFFRGVNILPLAEDPGVPMLEALLEDSRVFYEASPGRAAEWQTRIIIALGARRGPAS